MTRRSPAQKLAREIQAATGKPYTACLAEAKKRLGMDGSVARWRSLPGADGSVHTLPIDDEISHDAASECPCGPTRIVAEGGHIFSHASLDGREHPEAL